MSNPKGGYCVVSNLWIRQMEFMNSGDTMQGHKHNFDHATLCALGKFRVTLGDEVHVIDKTPCILYIKAGIEHKVEALQDGSIAYCLHGIHDPDDWDLIINPDMMPQFNGDLKIPLVEDEKDLIK